MNFIDIVMTTWKREEITKLSLKVLEKNTNYPYRLILIDNGSNSKAQSLYAKKADIYIKMDRNRGLEAAKHIGMDYVKSDYFISTDNDILVPPDGPLTDNQGDWLESLIMLADGLPEYAAIALRPQVLIGTDEKKVFKDEDSIVTEFSHVPGYMRIMNTQLTKKTGAWKDKRPLRGHEELWISNKFRDMGYKVGWATKLRCYHMFGEGNWGYKDLKPEEHGHTPIWPMPKDDPAYINKYFLEGAFNDSKN